MTTPLCPVCRKPFDPVYRPFCSRRCSEIDLHRWLTGHYVLSGDQETPEEGVPPDESEPGD